MGRAERSRVMNPAARRIQRIYLTLLLGNTLAASFIWGINTLFLLDAGLSNFEAFAANAFFTVGMVIFEIPTGVVADTVGRAGGVLAPRIRGLFAQRTTIVIGASLTSVVALVVLGVSSLFWLAIVFLVVWGFVVAVAEPVRQGYLNDMIPLKQRATVLSFDSLFGSLGGVFIQPALGRSADLGGYGTSLVIGGRCRFPHDVREPVEQG